MPLEPSGTAAVHRMLARLRAEGDRRPRAADSATAEGGEREIAAGLARMVLSGIGPGQRPSAILRAVAVGLAGTRQTFMASRDLSDLSLSEAMPVINHISMMAESLVRISDMLAEDEAQPENAEADPSGRGADAAGAAAGPIADRDREPGRQGWA